MSVKNKHTFHNLFLVQKCWKSQTIYSFCCKIYFQDCGCRWFVYYNLLISCTREKTSATPVPNGLNFYKFSLTARKYNIQIKTCTRVLKIRTKHKNRLINFSTLPENDQYNIRNYFFPFPDLFLRWSQTLFFCWNIHFSANIFFNLLNFFNLFIYN